MVNRILNNSEKIIKDINNSNLPVDTKEALLTILKMVAMNKANEKSTIDSNLAFVFREDNQKKK